MSEKLSFSSESLQLIDCYKNSQEHLFITGKAGTGKSTLLKHISKLDPEAILLAPTGIAAIHVQGDTIHSFFKLKPRYELDEAKHMRLDTLTIEKFADIKTIIIDEISMVRADIIDAINIFLQRVKKNRNSFGGVRMVFFGDLFQLPPVVQKNDPIIAKYKVPYFFAADVFKQEDLFSESFSLKRVELKHIHRQNDPLFIEILNAVRVNKLSDSQLLELNKQVNPAIKEADDLRINLVTTNAIADKINQRKLNEIAGEEISYEANHSGNIENLYPNSYEIKLKVGAQVMFINNDFQKRWVNGSIGKVVGYKKGFDEESNEPYRYLEVQLENQDVVEVSPYTWSISKYLFQEGKFNREEMGRFTQIPIKLAWAITIHKSQGKTFDKVMIDLGSGSFAHGQTYVALSRCRTLENIVLKTPLRMRDVIVDSAVIEYMGHDFS